MKKILIISLLIFISCKSTIKQESVDINILNSEINSLNKKDLNYNFSYNIKEKSIAKNTIKFELLNNTNKKQLIIFDPYSEPLKNLNLQIKDKYKHEKKCYSIIVDITDNQQGDYLDCHFLMEESELQKYENSGSSDIFTYVDYLKNSYILQPGEKRLFQLDVYLPLVSDGTNNYDGTGIVTCKNIVEGDSFNLKYSLDVRKYQNSLPKWELDELKRQKIEFYADTIFSNPVPIKIHNP